MHDGIVVVLVEITRGSDLLYKTTFVINVRIKSDFITNSVKYDVLKSWLQQKLVFRISEDGSEIELKHCASSKTSVKSSRKYFVHLNWIRLATNPC